MEKYQVLDVSEFDVETVMAICGESDCNLDLIGNNLGCKVFLEGDYILTSDEHTVERIRKIIKDMVSVFQNKGELEYQDVTNLPFTERRSLPVTVQENSICVPSVRKNCMMPSELMILLW